MEEVVKKYSKKWGIPAEILDDFLSINRWIHTHKARMRFARLGYDITAQQIELLKQAIRRTKPKVLKGNYKVW